MRFLAIICFFISFCIACSSPQRKLDKQDYNAAFDIALKEVQKKKSVSSNKKIMIEALREMIDRDLAIISKSSNSDDLRSLENAIDLNYNLQERIDLAKKYIGNRFPEAADSLILLEDELAIKLFDTYIVNAEDLTRRFEQTGLKTHAQSACLLYNSALQYAEGQSSQIEEKRNAICEKGILIMYVEAEAPFELFYSSDIDFKFRELEWETMDFKKIFYEKNPDQEIDCELEIYFGDLDTQVRRSRDSRTFTEEIVTGYRTVTDSTGSRQEPVYSTVTGTVTMIVDVKRMEWEIQATLESRSNNCRRDNRRFSVFRDSEIEIYQLSGDERAIPNRYKNNFEENFESDNDMSRYLIEEVYEEILRMYF